MSPGRLVEAKRPVLSVIIPVYNVDAYLAECLTSVLGQSLRNLEVLIVDDGSTDRCPEIIAAFAAADPRVRTFQQDNAGQGPARNLAVRHAQGRFLTFVDADDIIPPGTYQYMVNSLKKSGSDFSVGSVRRIKNGRLSQPAWNVPVHLRDRIGITIDEFPTALQDVIACNRMFRRKFWIDKIGDYRGGIVYEDHVPMVTAYVRATSFDILARVTYHWRMREDMTSTGQQKHALSNLRDRVEVKGEALEILQREASPTVRAAWVGRVLDTDFPPFIEHALVAQEEYRDLLRDAFARYRALADAEAMSHVRLRQKVTGYLASLGAWDKVETCERFFREGGSPPPTVHADGRILATDELSAFLGLELPSDVCELGAQETALQTCLRQAEWVDAGTLRLTGWSYIKSIDFEGRTPLTEVWLLDLATGERIDLPVELFIDPDATRWSGQRHANCDSTCFRVRLDTAHLVRPDTEERNWQLRFRVALDDIVREGTVHQSVVGSSASPSGLSAYPIGREGLQAVPRFDPAAGFVLTLRPPTVVATELATTAPGRVVHGRLRTGVDRQFTPMTVRATELTSKVQVEAPLGKQPDGSYAFSLTLPGPGDPAGVVPSEWDLRVLSDRGAARFLEWPTDVDDGRLALQGELEGFWQRLPRGFVRLCTETPHLLVTEATASDDEFRFIVDVGTSEIDPTRVVLRSSTVQVPLTDQQRDPDGRLVWRFANTASLFGLSPQPLATGSLWLELSDTEGRHHRFAWGQEVQQTLPLDVSTTVHQVRFSTNAQNQVRVQLAAPLDSAERGNWAETRLRKWYSTFDVEPEDSVLFQCYRGETATDSQRALHDALRAHDSDLTLYWGVADYATRVPDGGVPLLIGSRRWFEKLAASTYLCNNIDFDPFFRKRPHQRYLQTFHGYPFKSMGKTFWTGKGLSEDRIAYECERRNRDWDAILVPSEFCVDLYRKEYEYTGQVLVTGYPRSDVLLSATADELRLQTRAGLGIEESQTAILYAPTYRDSLTTRTFAARRFDQLDLDQLSERIGEDHVILVRGHNNNQREPDRVHGRSRIIDVTDYPEINDLTLAADVALLDYSSLRFDWAITGKPMLFFVPDLEDYFMLRPPLFQYEPTAPGPLLGSTAEVAEALGDLDRVVADFAEPLRKFNLEYNQLHDGHASDRVLTEFFGR
ncbi:CDP-glycerol glycerophosphotransferase [Microlunatus panaciterrae]|uniref:CDP-glycerol glycerophosphotransferase n=1 Tax=Microlunatus panaciterrae TaxID=400768 RepID=A0ABS2RG79_9ACTN|nr:CDP-glycerol glycerophosphotransferase family protein [Microlunatus panaciterrae]MBM7797191.1 CDP-glycerol glycerophosphotransferase [Microlunatus panaciterrae]